MNARLLRGIFVARDGHAVSDFEDLTVGPVTDITVGVDETGGCEWEETIIHHR